MTEETKFELTQSQGPADSTTVVITVSGELDLSVINTFSKSLEASFGEEGVVLDFDGVTFMDTSALHVVLRGKQRLDDSGVPAVLVANDDSVVATLFDLTGLEERLPRYRTVEEAQAALG